jgi:hypothetical protein
MTGGVDQRYVKNEQHGRKRKKYKAGSNSITKQTHQSQDIAGWGGNSCSSVIEIILWTGSAISDHPG